MISKPLYETTIRILHFWNNVARSNQVDFVKACFDINILHGDLIDVFFHSYTCRIYISTDTFPSVTSSTDMSCFLKWFNSLDDTTYCSWCGLPSGDHCTCH